MLPFRQGARALSAVAAAGTRPPSAARRRFTQAPTSRQSVRAKAGTRQCRSGTALCAQATLCHPATCVRRLRWSASSVSTPSSATTTLSAATTVANRGRQQLAAIGGVEQGHDSTHFFVGAAGLLIALATAGTTDDGRVAFASKRARNDRKYRVSGRRLARRAGIQRIYYTIEKDDDDDDMLTTEEVTAFFTAAGLDHQSVAVEEFMKALAPFADVNGHISEDNFAKFFTELLRTLFRRLDVDGSGAIEKCEVGTLLEVIYGTPDCARQAATTAECHKLLSRRKAAVERVFQMLLKAGEDAATGAESCDGAAPSPSPSSPTSLAVVPAEAPAGAPAPAAGVTVDQECFVDFMIDLLSTPGQGTSVHLARVFVCAIHGHRL